MTRSIIITGGNAGLGFETARLLAGHRDTEIVVACRNAALGQSAVADLRSMGGRATWLQLDLADQTSIRAFAEAFRAAKLPPLYGLICNAATQNVGEPTRVAEGYETTFAVNHLGHYLLTRLLLDDLVAGGRVTIVASGVHDPAQRSGMPHPDYVTAEQVAHNFTPGLNEGLRRYSTSKLCNVLFAYALDRRLRASGDERLASIRVNALDPGLMPATGLARSFPPHLQWVSRHILPLLRFVMSNVNTPDVSAKLVLDITLGSLGDPGGRYFSQGKAIRSSEQSYQQDKWHDLWVTSAAMTGLGSEITPTPRVVSS